MLWASTLNDFIQNAVQSLSDENAIDLILDSRDSKPFDSQWVQLDAEFASARSSLDDTRALDDFLDEQRKNCYKYVIRLSHSSELAAYVSDDAELILGCLALALDGDFLKSMINSYCHDTIPDGSMSIVNSYPAEIDWVSQFN
jgi:hypothetical protein